MLDRIGIVPPLIVVGALAAAVWAFSGKNIVSPTVEPPRLDTEKTAFDKRYQEARLHPVYEIVVTDKERGRFTITRYEIRRDCLERLEDKADFLVKIVHECRISNAVSARCDSKTITAYDAQMRVVGRPSRVEQRQKFPLKSDESHGFDQAQLINDLADGTISFWWDSQAIDAHFTELRRYVAEQKRRAAEYTSRTKPRG